MRYTEPRTEGDKALLEYLDWHFTLPNVKLPPFFTRLREEGAFYTPQPLPKRYRLGTPRNCYEDAALLALDSRRLTYVEGYAMSIFPVPHAWCVDPQGRVVDKTWAAVDAAFPTNRSNLAYFGLEIPDGALYAALHKNKVYGVFANGGLA